MVTTSVSYLTGRLPLAERAAACSGLGGGIAANRLPLRGDTAGAGEELPETPKDLRALGVDEVCG